MFIRCACCEKLTLKSKARKVRKNGQEYYLAPACYKAAVEVHNMLKPASRAEAAKKRHESSVQGFDNLPRMQKAGK